MPLYGHRLWSFILDLLDSVVRSAERLYEGDLCPLGHRRNVSALCLRYTIYHRADHPMHECIHHVLAARNIRVIAALGELALMSTCSRTDNFSQLFLPVAVRLWNLLPSGVFSG